MHLPLPTVDHRIGLSPRPFEERSLLRRSEPQALRFDLPIPGAPMAPRALSSAPPIRPPSRLRVRIGRLLVQWGERLAGPALSR